MHKGVNVDEKRGIMEVRSYADSTKEDIAGAISEVSQVYKEKGFYKVLADTTEQESMPNTVDIFNLFSKFPRKFRTAMLLAREQKTEEDLIFAETVARNRGIIMKMFYDKEQALLWLSER